MFTLIVHFENEAQAKTAEKFVRDSMRLLSNAMGFAASVTLGDDRQIDLCRKDWKLCTRPVGHGGPCAPCDTSKDCLTAVNSIRAEDEEISS